jgi:hypothetical protein
MNFKLKGYDRVQALYLIKQDIKRNGDRFGEKRRNLEKIKLIQKIKTPSFFNISPYYIENRTMTNFNQTKREKRPLFESIKYKFIDNKIPYYTLSTFKETFGNLDLLNGALISKNNEDENENKKKKKDNNYFEDIPPILPVKKNRWKRNVNNNKSLDYELSNQTNLISIATNTENEEEEEILFQTEPNKFNLNKNYMIHTLRDNGFLIDKRLSNRNYFNHHHKFLDTINSKKAFFEENRRKEMYNKYKVFPSNLLEGRLNYKDFYKEINGIVFQKNDLEEEKKFKERRKRIMKSRMKLDKKLKK